jgi:hypothetical protein
LLSQIDPFQRLRAERFRQPQLTPTRKDMRQRQVILPTSNHHFDGNTFRVDI